jgi:hypothetical protein
VHPSMHGRGVGRFIIEQLQHLARLRGCTHLVLEVAENNRDALAFYRHLSFQKLDAAIFMAQKIASEPELLPPRMLKPTGSRASTEQDDEEVGVRELPEAAAPPSAERYRAKDGSAVPARRKRPRKKRRSTDE